MERHQGTTIQIETPRRRITHSQTAYFEGTMDLPTILQTRAPKETACSHAVPAPWCRRDRREDPLLLRRCSFLRFAIHLFDTRLLLFWCGSRRSLSSFLLLLTSFVLRRSGADGVEEMKKWNRKARTEKKRKEKQELFTNSRATGASWELLYYSATLSVYEVSRLSKPTVNIVLTIRIYDHFHSNTSSTSLVPCPLGNQSHDLDHYLLTYHHVFTVWITWL